MNITSTWHISMTAVSCCPSSFDWSPCSSCWALLTKQADNLSLCQTCSQLQLNFTSQTNVQMIQTNFFIKQNSHTYLTLQSWNDAAVDAFLDQVLQTDAKVIPLPQAVLHSHSNYTRQIYTQHILQFKVITSRPLRLQSSCTSHQPRHHFSSFIIRQPNLLWSSYCTVQYDNVLK